MISIKSYEDLNIPEWSISYLINGYDSGISDEDKNLVDRFMHPFYEEAFVKNAYLQLLIDTDSDPSFCNSPEFGLPCNCYNGKIIFYTYEQPEV